MLVNTSQILDDGDDNNVSYNHYNDWISPDADSNGIVDVEYSLDGDASNSDPFPIVDSSAIAPTTATTTGTITNTNTTSSTTGDTGTPLDITLIAGVGVAIVVLLVIVFVVKRR